MYQQMRIKKKETTVNKAKHPTVMMMTTMMPGGIKKVSFLVFPPSLCQKSDTQKTKHANKIFAKNEQSFSMRAR